MSQEKYGSFSELKLMELPVRAPQKGQVRVRVHASGLSPADYKVGLGLFKFLHARNFPMTLGYDFSGVIEALGEETQGFKVGDAVFGFLPYGPFNNQGAFGETLVANVKEIALKPANVSHVQAAASATPALTSIQSIRDIAKLPAGGSILITGVSGAVGSAAILVALRLGATVTAVGSGRGLDLAKKLGASTVLDRKQGDVVSAAKGSYDVVFDAAAAYRWDLWKSKLKSGGTYVTTLPSASFAIDKLKSLFSSSRVGFVNVKSRAEDLKLLGSWLESGFTMPVEATIPVRDIGAGLAKLQRGEVLGRVAVDVSGGF